MLATGLGGKSMVPATPLAATNDLRSGKEILQVLFLGLISKPSLLEDIPRMPKLPGMGHAFPARLGLFWRRRVFPGICAKAPRPPNAGPLLTADDLRLVAAPASKAKTGDDL